jgi:hypothetical protein
MPYVLEILIIRLPFVDFGFAELGVFAHLIDVERNTVLSVDITEEIYA